jgi:hypothetical protein
MKNKILIGIVVLAIAALAAFNVNMNSKSNNLSDMALANVEALADVEVLANGESNGGENPTCGPCGVGATGCTLSQDYPGGLGSSKSVTCGSGYYACCAKDTWGNLSASCVKY